MWGGGRRASQGWYVEEGGCGGCGGASVRATGTEDSGCGDLTSSVRGVACAELCPTRQTSRSLGNRPRVYHASSCARVHTVACVSHTRRIERRGRERRDGVRHVECKRRLQADNDGLGGSGSVLDG
jgi:hypothetical protein